MRNIQIDLLKGFAIALVVLGHSVQFLSDNNFENPLFKFIYAFHMPLFMFLSGYVCFKPHGEKHINLRKRFKTLIIPFFVWCIIHNICVFLFPKNIISLVSPIALLINPDNGLWFLWVLFFLCLFLQISFTITKKYEELVMFLIAITLSFIVYYIPYGKSFGIPLMLWYIVFFTFGYIFHKYEIHFTSYHHYWGIISILLFLIAIPFWHFGTPFTFLEDYSLPIWSKKILYLFYRYFVPFCGILSFYYLFNLFPLKNLLPKLILYLAPITLEIYAIHYYFLYLLSPIFSKYNSINFYLKVIILAFIALIGSLLIQRFISKNKYINKFLFGK
jgi:putative membrane-bound acyltransferase ykrP